MSEYVDISGTSRITPGYTLIANASGNPTWQYASASGTLVLDPA